MKLMIIPALALCAACSHDPLEPGAGDNAGGGTNTLLVTGTALATPQIANAKNAADFDTAFDVRIQLNNAPVTTGTVTLKSAHTTTALTFTTTGQGNNFGHWTGDATGYDGLYQLDVTSGADTVTGVIVDGPEIHTITAPTAGATLDASMTFTATWDRVTTADTAHIQVSDGQNNGVDVADTGTYLVAAGTLNSSKDQARTNTFRITRSNRISPAGALAGSELTVAVENELDVVAAPCPVGCQN